MPQTNNYSVEERNQFEKELFMQLCVRCFDINARSTDTSSTIDKRLKIRIKWARYFAKAAADSL